MPRPWSAKVASAFRGLWLAVYRERSFAVHLPVAGTVLVTAALMRVSLLEWCLLWLCIAVVLAAETFNTALEFLSREITHDERPGIAMALDMGSAAVLWVSIGAAAVGGILFISRAAAVTAWWK